MAKVATRGAYRKAPAELAKENKKILVLDADLSGSTEAGEVKKVAPEQHFNFGIAEGNMMVATADITASGSTVFVNTFTMFTAERVFEQVCNSICYPHLSVKVCATHAGFATDEDGASHQSVEDVALTRGIPGTVVVSPIDGVETKAAIRAVTEYDGPCYIRLGRMVIENVCTEDTLNFQTRRGNVIHKGDSVALITAGIIVEAAMKVTDILKENGMDITVVDMHTIKPIDEELIVELIKDHDLFITCEEHSIIGGLGSAVAEVLSQKTPKKFAMIGIKDTFGESGIPAVLPEKYGPTANDIVKAVEDNK